MLVVIKKYKFYIKKTDFIGFIIKLRQISMDLKKIKAIDRKSTRLNSSHVLRSRMPSSA